jgi:hypothetical protein
VEADGSGEGSSARPRRPELGYAEIAAAYADDPDEAAYAAATRTRTRRGHGDRDDQ